jgi:hypothetical protein
MRDPDSVALKKERDSWEEQRTQLGGNEATLRDRARLLQQQSPTSTKALNLFAKANELEAQEQALVDKIFKVDETLRQRGQNLAEQADTNLAAMLMSPGEQIRHAAFVPATLVQFATPDRVPTAKLERTLEALRRERADLIDLRPVKTPDGYAVSVSVKGNLDGENASDLAGSLTRAGRRSLPGVFSDNQQPLALQPARCLEMDLITIEEPLVNHLSPVARAVNACLSLFIVPAGPERRVSAIGRSLRAPGQIENVGVRALKGENDTDHSIRIDAIFDPNFSAANVPTKNDVLAQRFSVLLHGANGLELTQARDFYDRVVAACSEQRLTIAAPDLASGFVPMKYDYMTGYLWLLLLGIIGFWITVVFLRRERKGLIRKRGVEEPQLVSVKAHRGTTATDEASHIFVRHGAEQFQFAWSPSLVKRSGLNA